MANAEVSWIIEPNPDPSQAPTVMHRHPNGLLPVAPGLPSQRNILDQKPVEVRAFVCACGEAYEWQRADKSQVSEAG
jgi:hypothetical protein